MDDLFLDTYYFFVLIETYWNVKIPRYFDPFFERGINRNILECKGRFWMALLILRLRINRNILECKVRC